MVRRIFFLKKWFMGQERLRPTGLDLDLGLRIFESSILDFHFIKF